LDDELDRPREACGVFGIYAPGADVARLAFFALYALQHRGQESAGIATSDGRAAYIHKDMGLVAQVFNEENLAPLKVGKIATRPPARPIFAMPNLISSKPFTGRSAWDTTAT
jgi:amidophosphoribosyltransferase